MWQSASLAAFVVFCLDKVSQLLQLRVRRRAYIICHAHPHLDGHRASGWFISRTIRRTQRDSSACGNGCAIESESQRRPEPKLLYERIPLVYPSTDELIPHTGIGCRIKFASFSLAKSKVIQSSPPGRVLEEVHSRNQTGCCGNRKSSKQLSLLRL